jgi:hypothetical protein
MVKISVLLNGLEARKSKNIEMKASKFIRECAAHFSS